MEELIVTVLALLLPPIIPTLTAWSHPNWKGVVLGALTLWIFMALGEALVVGRYAGEGPAGLLLVLWVLAGLPVSLVYCWVVLKIRRSRKEALVEPIPPIPTIPPIPPMAGTL
jgi:hypothetical protein